MRVRAQEDEMRGRKEEQDGMFVYTTAEKMVPADHPLREIKRRADSVLKRLSRVFDEMYSDMGKPSIPPERLLKGRLLIALYSVRSERLFCEMLRYNILFKWFLDMEIDDDAFDASTYSKNQERLMSHDVSRRFFDEVVRDARHDGLLGDEHFSVDGTLIEAWASMKSFKPKDESKDEKHDDDDPGNPTVDFHGEKRSNETHQSTTDPEARLMRKGKGKEAKLCFMGHVLMANRSGLCLDVSVSRADGRAEREEAKRMLSRQAIKHVRPRTLGADKGYHTKDFVGDLRKRGIAPHIAQIEGRDTPGMDKRTTNGAGYMLSQKLRKKVEEIFGWVKTVGGFEKTRYKGVARTQQCAYITYAAYNLLRLAKLAPL
jgi:transposase